MNQARALGEWWYSVLRTPIHKIYASDLKRAHSTAIQLVAPRTSLPEPDKHPLACSPIQTTPLIREKHFGIAEGKRWSAGSVSKKKEQQQRRRASAHDDDGKLVDPEDEVEVYEAIRNRHDRFTSGESLDDLALRRMRWRGLCGRIWTTRLRLRTTTQIPVPVPVRIRMGSRG